MQDVGREGREESVKPRESRVSKRDENAVAGGREGIDSRKDDEGTGRETKERRVEETKTHLSSTSSSRCPPQNPQ